MSSTLLSSAEAAEDLGASPTSVKRWADEGLLACVKTAGGHRRFERDVIERFKQELSGTAMPEVARGELQRWIDALLRPSDPHALGARLLEARARRGSWWRVADELGPVLGELGDLWQAGRITVLDEHLASERLSRALARAGEWLPVLPDAPRALLVTAEGDEHTLGLSLVELCLRELGWYPMWSGRRTPHADVERALADATRPIAMVAVSASASAGDRRTLAAQARRLAHACRAAGASLVLGGAGPWPEPPPHGVRLRGFESLHRYVLTL